MYVCVCVCVIYIYIYIFTHTHTHGTSFYVWGKVTSIFVKDQRSFPLHGWVNVFLVHFFNIQTHVTSHLCLKLFPLRRKNIYALNTTRLTLNATYNFLNKISLMLKKCLLNVWEKKTFSPHEKITYFGKVKLNWRMTDCKMQCKWIYRVSLDILSVVRG